jgi:hypothetical protein
MSDIFDEVDDILSELDSTSSEMDMADSSDNNFNETELQDIMAEFESLENEFETTPVLKSADLQDEIDRELAMAEAMSEPVVEATIEPTILAFEKKSTPTVSNSSSSSNSEISFEAHGQMNLNLVFKIGEENAKLVIDPVRGLIITMSGVELCINQEDGCKVTMDTGVKFTIPMNTYESSSKKKSA